jgi:hypothetical protein
LAFRSQPPQDFIIGSIFGWKKTGRHRRFRRAYIEQGKGNGKSPLAGGIGLYGLMADGEAGAEIYSAGATKDQAGILFRDAVKMVDKSPDLEARLKMSGGPGASSTSPTWRSRRSSGRFRGKTRKTGSGPRPHFALVDEIARACRSRRHGDTGARLQVPPAAAAADDHEQRQRPKLGVLDRARARGEGGGRQPRCKRTTTRTIWGEGRRRRRFLMSARSTLMTTR